MATCSLHNLLNASLLSESGPPLLDFEVKYGCDFTVETIKIFGLKFVVPCMFDVILEAFMLSDKFGLHFLILWFLQNCDLYAFLRNIIAIINWG